MNDTNTTDPTGSDSNEGGDGAGVEDTFDETNGLAGNLEGDDGGSDDQDPDDAPHSLLSNILAPDESVNRADGDHGYSEEGRE
jgi:hypothetical protein